METKHPEISQPFKQVILELHSNGKKKKYKQLQAVSTDLWIMDSVYGVIRKFQSTRLIENSPRSGGPHSLDDREYRKLQRIETKIGGLRMV